MKLFFGTYPLLLLLLFPLAGFGFNLTITQVNETCSGNGSLTLAVSNTDPNGSVAYVVYKLPDTTTPYASGTNTTINGLAAGIYRIIARETVGSTTTTQQQDVTISSSFIPLTYTVQTLNQACVNTSTISVTATTGTAATYEIISGPATYPPQASNTFSGLAVGLYRIKVTDNCGNAVVQAFTVNLVPPSLTVNSPSYTNTTPPSCNSLVANATITAAPGTVIAYPLHIDYVLHLSTGVTHMITILNSGNPTAQPISQTVPYQANQQYVFDVIVTDACGTTYPGSSFIPSRSIILSSAIIPLECNQYYFTLTASGIVDSYTLHFDTAPPGFNPAAFNTTYPGLYTQALSTFGSNANPAPIGNYKVTITDNCGRTAFKEFSITSKPPTPTILGVNNGCLNNDGKVVVMMTGYKIVTAFVTAAPANYPFPLPHNVSALINGSQTSLTLDPVPIGDYTVQITDNCGDSIPPLSVTIPVFQNQGFAIDELKGCGTDRSSIKITSQNGKPVSAQVTAAPAGYAFPLPHDITANIISTGELYLTGLQSGNYTFSLLDNCGFTSTKSTTITGYTITKNNFSLIPDCGAFNIPLDFVSNLVGTEVFWLQKLLDSTTNTWGNPETDAVYIEGTVPNTTNSYKLQNNATNYNFTFNGVFRIVHNFTSYNSGIDINSNLGLTPSKDCVEILSPTLSFNNALAINNVYLIPCSSSGNFDVFLSTNGTQPLQYSIVEKDGNPFVVNNGNSHIFQNLSTGIYKFEIEDSCGNSVNMTFDVSDLTSLVTIYPTCPLFKCVPIITGNETFDLSSQNATILGIQSPSEYTLSYHTSQSDADNNISSITGITNFDPATNPQTIYVRLIFNQFPNCYQTGSFDLIAGQVPRINLLPEYVVCDSQPIQLDASSGNLASTSYLWSNGSTASTVTVSDIGTTNLNVTATNLYGMCVTSALSCSISKDITVNIADIPKIDHIDLEDWTDTENSITIVPDHAGDFEYSIDGINFQDTPEFLNLLPGLYTVYARDAGGCRTVTEVVWLLSYPKFFTPNGDGYNETWYVRNSANEPEFKVFIYDRYGKLITNIVSNGPGWDGKRNGKLLFADDYWFVAYRQDGRILKGHFTLKR